MGSGGAREVLGEQQVLNCLTETACQECFCTIYDVCVCVCVCVCFETGSHAVTQAGLKILLPPPSECWDYRHASLHLDEMIFLFAPTKGFSNSCSHSCPGKEGSDNH
jgi:hypothetical protein